MLSLHHLTIFNSICIFTSTSTSITISDIYFIASFFLLAHVDRFSSYIDLLPTLGSVIELDRRIVHRSSALPGNYSCSKGLSF